MVNNVLMDQSADTTEHMTTNLKHHELMTIRQFCEAFPWPSQSAMRAYVYRAEEMGISEAFLRVGRRVLVAPSKFFTLIQQIEGRSIKGGIYESAS